MHDIAVQITNYFFADVLPDTEWNDMCDSISQALMELDCQDCTPGRLNRRSTTSNLQPLFVGGGQLFFGGQLSDFSRDIIWLMLALSVLLGEGQ